LRSKEALLALLHERVMDKVRATHSISALAAAAAAAAPQQAVMRMHAHYKRCMPA
jgi:hypothetical protein